MQTLSSVRKEMNARANEARRLDRLVQSERFANAFALKKPNEIVPLDELELWMERKLTEDIELLNLRDLRLLAAKLGIVKYTYWTKDSLLIKVKNALSSKEAPSRMYIEEGRPGVGVGGLGQLTVLHQPGARGTTPSDDTSGQT